MVLIATAMMCWIQMRLKVLIMCDGDAGEDGNASSDGLILLCLS